MTRIATAALVVGVALVAMPLAQTPLRIIRFEPRGSAGVSWESRGNDRTHYYYRSAQNKNTAAGIWTSPDGKTKPRL